MGKITIAGAGFIYDPQSADYPQSDIPAHIETFENTIDSALGYRDITITNGDNKRVLSCAWTQDLGSLGVVSAEITSNTNLRVYSSLGVTDPGNSFTVSITNQ
jgi:hypothetical protein